MSGGDYLAAAYAAFLVLVLAYLVIMAAKVARLERDVAELAETVAPNPDGEARG